MKFRFTLGNIVGLVTAAASYVAAHSAAITSLNDHIGGILVTVSVAILAFSEKVAHPKE